MNLRGLEKSKLTTKAKAPAAQHRPKNPYNKMKHTNSLTNPVEVRAI
jgi:hypothetical protein